MAAAAPTPLSGDHLRRGSMTEYGRDLGSKLAPEVIRCEVGLSEWPPRAAGPGIPTRRTGTLQDPHAQQGHPCTRSVRTPRDATARIPWSWLQPAMARTPRTPVHPSAIRPTSAVQHQQPSGCHDAGYRTGAAPAGVPWPGRHLPLGPGACMAGWTRVNHGGHAEHPTSGQDPYQAGPAPSDAPRCLGGVHRCRASARLLAEEPPSQA